MSTDAQYRHYEQVVTEGDLLFTESCTESDNRKPVGVSDSGILVWNYPGAADSLTVVPYSDIRVVELALESRMGRIVRTTLAIVGCVFVGCIGTGVLLAMLDGRATGMGALILSVIGPVCLLGALFLPLQYFGSLGVFFRIHADKKTKSYLIDAAKWDEMKSQIMEKLEANGISVRDPRE